jgi:N-acetylmuramoyl-L-alanine amidase
VHRSRLVAPLAALAASFVVAPILATVALAADPTVTVKRGDTLTAIAKRNGVDIATIVALNQIADPNRIYAGQQLRIGTDPAAAPVSPASQAAPAAPRVHVVARGENLTRIAAQYGVTVADIAAANGIVNPSRIFGGQQLVIPGAAAAAAAPAVAPAAAPSAPRVHVVARGENLTRIAGTYGVTVADIVAANGIVNPSRIFGGQQLVIPSAPAAAAGPEAVSVMPPSMAALVASRDDVRQLIAEEANRYGVPVPFALAVAWQESGWQQHAVSSAGAVGVMQLMPATAAWVGEAMLGQQVQIDDARSNVRGGVRLLAHYLARYAGDRDLVLAAYYQGQSAVDRHGIYPISQPYVASIKRLERLFGG